SRRAAPAGPRTSGFPDQARQRPAPAGDKRSFAPTGPCSDLLVGCGRRSRASVAEARQAQASANEQSRPRSRPGLSSAPAWLRTRHTRGIGGSLAGDNPIHALAVGLLRLQPEPEPELLAHHGGQEGAHRVRLPAGGARDGGDGGAARSAQQCQHPRLLRIRSPRGLTAADYLRTDLGCRPRLDGARRFALGHAKLLSRASAQQRAAGLAQQRAATIQTPRRPIGAGGVRGASRSGSASVITTHALFARKVQRKLSNGVAGFAAGGSSLDQRLREGAGCWPPARAAYHRRRSSNANGLRGQNSAGFPQISATFQRANLRRHFSVRISHAQPDSPVSVGYVRAAESLWDMS